MADTVAVTHTFVADTPALAGDVNTNFSDLVTYLNGRLGNATNTQILVADASGRLTHKTMSGDATISNTGVVTLATEYAQKPSTSNQNLTADSVFNTVAGCFYTAVKTGVFLVEAHCPVHFQVGSSALMTVSARLTSGFSVAASTEQVWQNTNAGDDFTANLSLSTVVACTAGSNIALQVTGDAGVIGYSTKQIPSGMANLSIVRVSQ